MREVARLVIVPAPLPADAEERRWYSQGAESCIVLTRRRRLLEPSPIFGPTSYRLLGLRVSTREAQTYARAHGFRHERVLPAPPVPR